jgi:DNA-binding MarR family transcriptional regulator
MAPVIERPSQPIGETLQFMQRLWELAHALDVRSKRMVKSLGVTGPQRLVIRMIGQKPRMTASTIASTLKLHPSTLTGILARLEQREMVQRLNDPEDRRRSRFVLTRRGTRIDRERRGTVEAAVRRALARSHESAVAATFETIGLLVDELLRVDPA